MLDSKHVSTTLSIGTPISLHDGASEENAIMFRQVLRGLQNLYMTRPIIFLIVNKLSQFMQALLEHYWGVIKRLLKYLNGTHNLGF